MPIILSALGSLGGLVAFIGAIWIIMRSIFAQSFATRENTKDINELKGRVSALERAARNGGR